MLKLLNEIDASKNGFFKLDSVASSTSNTAEKVSVLLRVKNNFPQ